MSARLEVVVVRRRVSEGLWRRVAPLLPVVERRFRYPGRKRVADRLCLEGILFVLCSGLPWREVPAELGVSGITCWRRLAEWQQAGVWEQLLAVLVSELSEQGQLDPARLIVDASIAPAKKGARKLGQARWIAGAPRLSDT